MSIIKTPRNKVEIELKDWITGEEGENIDAPMTDVQFKVNSQGQGGTELNMGKLMRRSTKIAVEIVVTRVDKETTGLWEKIRQMPKEDYKFILKQVDNIVTGKDFTKPVLTQKDGIV